LSKISLLEDLFLM